MALILRTTNGKGIPSPFWYAAFNWRGADGHLVRVKKSTGTKDKREAQGFANQLEGTVQALVAGRLTMERLQSDLHDLDLRAREFSPGREMARCMHRALVELSARITGEAITDYTAATWLRDWLKQKEATTKPSTLASYRSFVKRFLTFLGKKATGGLQHIRPSDVHAFRQSLMDAGRSGVTCNLAVKVLAMPFRKAQRLGIIRLNPTEGVEALENDGERRQAFTMDQVRAIYASAPSDEWRGLIVLAFYTGARLGDCARMRWSNVDLKARTVAFMPAKTSRGKRGKQIFIPMHAALHAFLMTLDVPDDATAYVFPSLATVKLSGNTGLSRRFHAIMDAAGVSAPLAREKGKAIEGVKSAGREVRSLTFHSLRHTLTSLMHNAGVSRELRMQVTGHATQEAHEIYTHTELETLRTALATVPSL